MDVNQKKIIDLLKQLIATPSFSTEEENTASIIDNFFRQLDIDTERLDNNVWVRNKLYDSEKPTILLNSHHDTVKPNKGYTIDPFKAIYKHDKLFGLGSNDAGGCLVSLIATFLHFYDSENLAYNIILAATAEEEISGKKGIESIVSSLGDLDFAIVGEPTLMNMAIAEKGLMVLDCVAKGTAGHAARNEGDNAIYKAMKDIEWFQSYQFSSESESLGPIKMNVTMIESGTQHNVVPNICKFVVDVRTTDLYTNEETLEIIRNHIQSEVKPRSTRLKPSGIGKNHPIIRIGEKMGLKSYGSPTLSDQALLSIPSLKLGPGDSSRSHMADEYIFLNEIVEGIDIYKSLLNQFILK